MDSLFPGYLDRKAAQVFVADAYNDLVKEGVITRSVDFCPYTEDFERVYGVVSVNYSLDKNGVWCLLINERKKGNCQAPKGAKE